MITSLDSSMRCPHCKHRFGAMDNYEPNDNDPPIPGDGALCMNCGEIGIFTRINTVRKPTRQERLDFMSIDGVIYRQILIKHGK
jgi:hypothetical protein